jgi:hypothetical protein
MPRTLLGCVVLAVVVFPCRAEQAETNSETLIRLNVSPVLVPKPALRYLLLPELNEMKPGNPVHGYFKCCMDNQGFLFDQDAFDRREKLLAMPLTELPAQKLEEDGQYALSQADRAARLDNPDWQILSKLKTDGVGLLLPDIQNLRGLARALLVRFRAEVAQGRFDQALTTAKTMFALSRHLGQHPTLIGELVGISVASMAIAPLEEMTERPGCPNLYWGLTNLPNPLISLEKGIDGERVIMLAEFRDLDDQAPMNAAQLKKFMDHMDMLLGDGKPANPGESRMRAWLDQRTKKAEVVSAARSRLVEVGFSQARLLAFPADQVILLDEKREYMVRRDDIMKFMNLPAWQMENQLRQHKPSKEPALFAELAAGLEGVRRAQARLEQRIALLRHIEALRHYAAEHKGSLPTRLSEISIPLPEDPFTGKPFRYELAGTTAHVRGGPPPGMEKEPAFNIHYELTVQK